MKINFINLTTIDAYFHMGLGTINGTFDGAPVNASTSVHIAQHSTVTGLDVTSADAAKLLFSLGSELPTNAPDFQYNGGPGWNIRWDKIEFTLKTDTNAVSQMNLSSADFYGLDLQVQTYASKSATAPVTTLTWREGAQELFPDLAAIANKDTAIAVAGPSGAKGVEVPGVGNVLRVIAPSTVPAAHRSSYASMQPYVDYVKNQSITTKIYDLYTNGATTTDPAKITQYVTFTATVPKTGVNAGDIVMVGSGDKIGANHTIVIDNPALAILSANPDPFFVDGVADNFANNDAYGVVVRDILAGFNAGLVGSTEINPNTGTVTPLSYANSTAGFRSPGPNITQWYSVPDPRFAFAGAQPHQSTFFNGYAQVIALNSDSYGFPYTDTISAPLANINPGTIDHIDITILPDDLTELPEDVPCFAAGTRIETVEGEVAVQELRPGDAVLTVSGKVQRVVWIGRRRVDCRRHPSPATVWPVRVEAGAFGTDRPRRPLLLSPDHAVYVQTVLVPIRHLVNGTTVRQTRVDEITYHHVELARHDVLLADGLPAESYLETGRRGVFENGGAAIQLHPTFEPDGKQVAAMWDAFGYAPLVVGGEALDRVRQWLAWQTRQCGASIAAHAARSTRHAG
ncbi:MAG: Hint domain-containing protein [Acetobacteraceae bacterium]